MSTLMLFGNPVSHSLSPNLHQQFAKQFDMVLDYQIQLVLPGEFKKCVDVFRAKGGIGANITSPCKTDAFWYADEHTDRAIVAGVANTFIFKNKKCIADTTDGIGFVRALRNHDVTLYKKHILILGAGGAVRAILGDIIHEKPEKIFLHNRTIEKAKALATHFEKKFPIHLFSQVPVIDIFINATMMNFQTDCDWKIDLSHTICCDLNYGDQHKTFLTWAKKNGAPKILDGLGMLIEQGAESFFQWFGKRPKTNIHTRLANAHSSLSRLFPTDTDNSH